MKVLAVVAVVFLVLAVSAKEYRLKVKNPESETEENDVIDVDETRGTETISSDGESSMKDFNTGYGAIKSEDMKECFIFKIDEPGEQQNIADLQKDLDSIQESGGEPVVTGEKVKYVSRKGTLTQEKRAEIGQNLLDFCAGLNIVLGTEDEADDGDQATHVRRKRATCYYRFYRRIVCYRGRCYYRYYYRYICFGK